MSELQSVARRALYKPFGVSLNCRALASPNILILIGTSLVSIAMVDAHINRPPACHASQPYYA
jgi:hypothetical protein